LVDERKRDVTPIDLLGCMAVNLTVADFLLLIVTYGVTVRLTMLEVTTGPDGFGSHGLAASAWNAFSRIPAHNAAKMSRFLLTSSPNS
jgi:hypothetical protein